MITLKQLGCVMGLAVATLFAGLEGASAAPIAPAAIPKVESSTVVDQVHWRGYRHCHWRHGDRRCHGGRYYRGYWGGGPGIYLRFGRGWGHHGWRHRHWGHRGWGHRGRHW